MTPMYASLRDNDRLQTPLCYRSRVHPGEDSLPGSFLISGGSVDLPCEKQPADTSRFQRGGKLDRIDRVVFNRVAESRNSSLFHSGNRAQRRFLHVRREAGAHTLHVILGGSPAFRFQEDGVALLVDEPSDLVFDGRAVSRTNSIDRPVEHRGAMQICSNDVVRLRLRSRS